VDDSHSSSGSESVDVECIDIFSSSSSSEHLATKESDHSSSSSSDNESDEEESLPGAWKVRSLTNEDSDISSTSSSIVDSDSDEDVDNNKENQSGATISRVIRSHSLFTLLNDEEKEAPQELSPSLHDSNRPLSPWTNCSSKALIIQDLKNDKSSIHALIASGWETNLDELWKKYAPRYQRSKFKGYMKTIMSNYSAKKGAFKDNFTSTDPCSPLSWDKSNSRKRIISDLKDYRSSIHGLVKDWEKKQNLEKLWQEYAPQYQRRKFKGYMETIMKNFRAKKGEFKDTWSAKKDGNRSKEYSLLYKLMMKNDIVGMSVAEVHANHALFTMYPLDEFKRYYNNMKGITDKAKARLNTQSEIMEKNFVNWNRAGPKTSQGNYFWDEQDAATFLEKDVKSGKVDEMSKTELWASRPAYKKFNKRVFRKHVYQEESKQRGGTYWQVKRNRKGQKMHDKEVTMLRRDFKGNMDEDVNELVDQWKSLKN